LQLNRSASHLKQILHLLRSAIHARFSRIVQQEHSFLSLAAPPNPVSRFGDFERNPAKVERLATDVIELSTPNQFAS
jgi:hypothetical protein